MDNCIIGAELAIDRKWGVLTLRGMVAIAFGISVFLDAPQLTLLFGFYALILGVVTILAGLNAQGEGKHAFYLLFEGIVSIAASLTVFGLPTFTILSLVTIIGGWAIITGVLEIITAINVGKESPAKFFLTASGIISVMLGILLLRNHNILDAASRQLLESYAVLFGCLMIILGLMVRNAAQEKPVS
jgi:uncharacterized membrane protein HdeD (DUF308 family)